MIARTVVHIAGVGLVAAATILGRPAGAEEPDMVKYCVNAQRIVGPDVAIKACTDAIRSGRWKGKELAWAYGNRCWALTHKKEDQAAIDDCNMALSLKPDLAFAYLNRGNAYYDLGDYNQAAEDYRAALRLEPSNTMAADNLKLAENALRSRADAPAGPGKSP